MKTILEVGIITFTLMTGALASTSMGGTSGLDALMQNIDPRELFENVP